MRTIQVSTPREAASIFAAEVLADGYKTEALHEYTDASGHSIYWRIRAKHPESGDKWIRPMHLTDEDYVLGEPELKGGKLLYNLAAIEAGGTDPVFVVEGEWCADKLSKLGITCTTSGSSSSASDADWRPLAGREITIWPDNDDAGQRYAETVAAQLKPLGCEVSVIDADRLDLPPKGDAVDWLETHPEATVIDVKALHSMAVKSDDPGEACTGSDAVLGFCEDCDLFTDEADQGYAAYQVGNHREIHSLDSSPFTQWLQKRYFDQTGKGLRKNTLTDALPTIHAQARFEGEVRSVYQRVAFVDDRIVLDICDDNWRVIDVTDQGWAIQDESHVMFARAPGMLPLPCPERNGSIEVLREFVNVTDGDFVLLVGWLMAALRGQKPFPVLVLGGEEGSGKSSLATVCRKLVDPSATPLTQLPKNDQDLFIRANNSFVLAFDNLSSITEFQSDALCRISYHGEVDHRDNEGDVRTTEITIAPVKQASGDRGSGYVSITRDVTDRKRTEAELDNHRKNLVSMVDEKTSALEREMEENREARRSIAESLDEKELLLKEVHHRVKNNMQVISSLLNIQAESAGNEQYTMLLGESQQRIKSMSLIHESLYQSDNLLEIDFEEYINMLANSLCRFYTLPGVSVFLDINVQNVLLDIETAVPCGLIINELVSNSLKHAFNEGQTVGTISISFLEDDRMLVLRVSDDGVGLPDNFNLDDGSSMGMEIVSILTQQLDGELGVVEATGAAFEISFPRNEKHA